MFAEDGVPADLVSQTYERIRDLIVRGRLAPGARVVESDLAARLDVSRTPVRSAIERLQQEGWLTRSDGGRQNRAIVTPLTKDDARELFLIIGALEGVAARGAAGLEPPDRKRVAGELRAINDELRAAAAAPDPDPWRVFELHSDFHLHLVAALRAPRLLGLHHAIKPQADRYRRHYSSALVGVAAEAADEHEAILHGIAAADPDAAEDAARCNWANAAERLARIIDTWGEKGSW